MKLRLDYGATGLVAEFPGSLNHHRTRVRAAVAGSYGDAQNAIRSPFGRRPLKELVKRGQKIGISVCDITRAQPRKLMLEALFSEMPETRLMM